MLRAQLVLAHAENLHRLDLTKDQRDQHIRRYAELLEAPACRLERSRANLARAKSEVAEINLQGLDHAEAALACKWQLVEGEMGRRNSACNT